MRTIIRVDCQTYGDSTSTVETACDVLLEGLVITGGTTPYGGAIQAKHFSNLKELDMTGVVDARSGELYPIPGKGDEQNRVAFQGHAHPDYPAIVRYFGVEYFDHWTRTPDREGLMKTYPPLKAPLLADGSVSLPVECGRPFRHFGYDEAGDKVAHGLTPLVCNEGECTCHGCHDAHSDERLEQLGWKTAEERFRGTLAGEAE